MAVSYNQRCFRCKKNYILVTYRNRYPLCYECQKADLNRDIKDPAMKKMFDIPEEFYEKNAFLRSIKINYLNYGSLTEKQLEAFKKAIIKMKKKPVKE